jgi:hypothetical protein
MTFIKGEVKQKHDSNGWSFSCFSADLFKQDLTFGATKHLATSEDLFPRSPFGASLTGPLARWAVIASYPLGT